MKPSIYRISLDVHDAHSSVCLDMKRQDTARQIDIALTDGGFPYRISEECYAVFAATKADGKKLLHHCEIRNNIIQYIVRPQTTAAIGLMECEIKLYGANDKLLFSPGFNILVSENAVTDDDDLISEDDVDELTHLISEAAKVITEGKAVNAESRALIDDMEAKRETLDQQIAETKEYAESANRASVNAGLARDRAEGAANLVVNNARQAETAAANAKTSENNAKTSAQTAVNMANAALQSQRAAEDAAKRAEEAAANTGGGPDSGQNPTVATVEPADDDIPKVYFTGILPTSKDEGDLRLFMRYISKTANFAYPVTLKVQGGSSVDYPKKNYTLKPYKDDSYEKKQKLTFKSWPEMNKFVLKAHWIDHSHVRNVGTARIWGKIVKSRSDYASLPEELRSAPNNGATDGFTVKVFVNGVYQGLYEWIVPKDKLFGQDSDIATHSIMNSESNSSANCAFSTTSPTVSGYWSEELQDELSSAISTSFANFIKFVAGASDTEFIENAENYFDVQSVIDFDILARVFCIVDNVARNQIFFTYDGTKWYEGCWDVDAVLGFPPIVRETFPYNTEFQTGYIAYKDHRVTNMLYQRVENLFTDRFKARYAELRADVLSIGNIIDVYERLTDTIVSHGNLLNEDVASTTAGGAFTGIPFVSENNIQQIRDFVSKRIPYMDEEVAKLTASYAPCTGITLSETKLTFTEEGSKTLIATVTPASCTDTVRWVSNNPDVADVIDGVVTVKANGSATITAYCGEYSASCSVSVSGIPEKIACTGITLDKSTLAFNGEGVQTITATVTPADTTDEIVWSTSNMYIATVENGVVTAKTNGNVVIRATCGNHYAECAVSITGIDTLFKLGETAFDGASDFIDTGVQLYDTDKDYSVSMEYTPSGKNTSGKALLHCRHEDISPLGMSVAIGYNGMNGCYTHRLYANSANIQHTDAFDHNADNTKMGDTWKWMGVSHNAAAKTYITARYDGSNVYCDEITADYYNISETLLIGCGQDKTGTKNNFWSGTVHDCKVLNKADTVAELFARIGFHDMSADLVWSDTAEYKLENNSHISGIISGKVVAGSNYVTHDMVAVPEGATKLVVYNKPNKSFVNLAAFEFAETTGNALKGNSTGNTNLCITLQEGTKYIRFAANPLNPNGNIMNTDPANNIGIMWM